MFLLVFDTFDISPPGFGRFTYTLPVGFSYSHIFLHAFLVSILLHYHRHVHFTFALGKYNFHINELEYLYISSYMSSIDFPISSVHNYELDGNDELKERVVYPSTELGKGLER